MKVLKKHMGQIVFSVLTAIIGVGFSVLPYYGLADIIVKIIAGDKVFANYYIDLIMVFAGFILGIIFLSLIPVFREWFQAKGFHFSRKKKKSTKSLNKSY